MDGWDIETWIDDGEGQRYKLVLTSHSMGGSITSLLSMLVRKMGWDTIQLACKSDHQKSFVGDLEVPHVLIILLPSLSILLQCCPSSNFCLPYKLMEFAMYLKENFVLITTIGL